MNRCILFAAVFVLLSTGRLSAQTTNPPASASSQTPLEKAGIKPIGDWSVDPAETQELNQIYATALSAANSIPAGPDWSVQRHAVNNALREQLESFLVEHPNSAYGPGVHVSLGRQAVRVYSYSLAMSHYQKAFDTASGSADRTAIAIALEAGGGLAKLLALTGQIPELDALVAQAMQIRRGHPMGGDWKWASEMRRWVLKHPTEAYKCGLYCLDQLGRLTQPGQFFPKNITETPSSTNGFTAADLLGIAGRVGLSVHAAVITDTNNLPVPCILHLRSEHFLVLRQQRGAFYEVLDPVAYGPKWLTAADLLEEASGCVLVSEAVPPANAASLVSMSASDAASYRGRCHGGLPADQNDNGTCQSSPCPPGTGGGPGCPGMPTWGVSEPYLNLWLFDSPITYKPAYGPAVDLNLARCARPQQSEVSGFYWLGAAFGDNYSRWSCSWLSFADQTSDGSEIDLMLPAGGWVIFDFPANSAYSSLNYRQNLWLEKQGPNAGSNPGAVTNLVLHYRDGSQISYGLVDTSDVSLAGIFYMTARTDPTGMSATFSYDSNFYLQTVTSADGTSFSLQFNDAGQPSFVTSVTSSYGASASFVYDSLWNIELTNITDSAGISSWISYQDNQGDPFLLVTPYGTTSFNNNDNDNLTGQTDNGVFDRIVEVTNAVGQVELYAQMNAYLQTDWPDFATSQIPTNTPVGTLDTDSGERQERNTFHWNVQQFAPYIGTDLNNFNWSIFMQGRIRHWLAATGPSYNHWDTLSVEEEASPDGTTEGQLTWYDYVGKSVDYEVGTQIMPSVIARVMPDGSTWCQYLEYLTNGLPAKKSEAWIDAGTVHARTNVFVYAANNVDLLAWTNALGSNVFVNLYNNNHEIVTNYDGLGQITTNGYDGTTHLITSSKLSSGLVTLYTYNGSHRLQSVVDLPVNRTNSYTWNSDGTMATHTDPRAMVESFFWDGLHRLMGTSDSRGTTTNLYYILSGNSYPNSSGGTAILDCTATKDRLGHWTSYVYDGVRRKVAETNANSVVTGYGYCGCGSLSSITNAWGAPAQEVTTFNFDNQGRLYQTVYQDSYTLTNWFDSLGRITVTGDGAANHWLFYNNLGLLTVRSNAYGAELQEAYDLVDRPVYVTDANGVMVTNTYDNLNRLLTRGYPDGGVEKYGYSASGLISYTNQIGNANTFTLDVLGRKLGETNANAQIISYGYDSAGDLLSLTDGKSQTTRWAYDAFGRLAAKTNQAGSVILVYSYDAQDRLLSRWSAAFATTYYTNDAVGNLTFIDYPHSPSVSLQYDWLNRLTNMVDASGTTKYTYTAGNQLWTEVQPFANSTVTNTYVNRLRTAMSLQQPSGLWTNKFVYDAAARLTNITSPAGVFSYTPGAASSGSSLAKKLALPNTSYITNTFDNVARLTGTYLDNSANTVLDSAVYSYNRANQRTAFSNAAGTYVQYSYDNIGQLKVAASSVSSENRGYTYDAAWNLNYLTNNGTLDTFMVDNQNQLTSDPNAPTDTYDANGNLQLREWSGLLLYAYTNDDENRLTAIQYDDYGASPPVSLSQFVYDGLGRMRKRVEFTYNSAGTPVWSTETHYIYDGLCVIQERDTNNTSTVSYTRGLDLGGRLQGAGGIDGLLARSSGYSGGNWSTHCFYHADGSGNITYLVDSSQAMAATYRYDPFGNTISSSGSQAAGNVYRFSSKECLTNTGTYYFLYRIYDPSLQRWMNRDPIQELGGMNLHRFVGNNPINLVDPMGLRDLCRPGKPYLGTGFDSPPFGTSLDYALLAFDGAGLLMLAPEALAALDGLAAEAAFAMAERAYLAQIAKATAAAAAAANANQALNFMNEYNPGYEQAEAAAEAAERTLELEQARQAALLIELNKAASRVK